MQLARQEAEAGGVVQENGRVEWMADVENVADIGC